MLLFKCGIQTIGKGNTSPLSQSCVLNFFTSPILERSGNDASEIDMFFFLRCNSERHIFLKLWSNSRWSFMAEKCSLERNLLLRIYVSLFFNI